MNSLDTVKFVLKNVRDSAHPPWRSGHILSRSHVTVTVSSEFSVVSADFQTQDSFHVRFKVYGLLCSNSCLHRQVSFASSPRRLARTCSPALHVSYVPNLVWMPMPSQICRHGSRMSLRIPILSKDVSEIPVFWYLNKERLRTWDHFPMHLHVAVPLRWKEFLYHRGSSFERDINPSSRKGQERRRQAVFFTPSDQWGDKAEEEFNNDVSRPRKVHYNCEWKPHQGAVCWIHLARAQEQGIAVLADKVSHVHDSVRAEGVTYLGQVPLRPIFFSTWANPT